jgi:phospholipase/carboxylesterase
MTVKLSGPMLAPQSGNPPRQAVVLLHGYASDGEDLISLGTHWQDLLPDALFVSPNAPTVSEINPMGFQWFALDHGKPDYRVEGARQGSVVIIEFLKDLWAQTGLTERDTILVGFSQGAMMALHVGLSLDDPLLGIVSFSGALIPLEGFDAGHLARPPVCLVHGDLDQVVDPKSSQDAAIQLQAHGYEVSYHVSVGTAHGIAPDGLDFATSFMLAQRAAAND